MSIQVLKNKDGKIYADANGNILQVPTPGKKDKGYRVLKTEENKVFLSPNNKLLIYAIPGFDGIGYELTENIIPCGSDAYAILTNYTLHSMSYIPQGFAKLNIASLSGKSAFKALQSISGDLSAVQYIGYEAFYGFPPSTSTYSFDFPNCTKIENRAFGGLQPYVFTEEGYEPVPNVVLTCNFPKVEYIGSQAFYQAVSNTISLPELTLPVCSYIGESAFENLNIQTLNLLSTSLVSLGGNPFVHPGAQSFTGTIYVPTSLVEDYKAANIWSIYASQISAYNG